MKKLSDFAAILVFGFIFSLTALAAPGDLDPAFGIGGKVLTPMNAVGELPNRIAIQPDGKILVAGNGAGSFGIDLVVTRYNIDGSLDGSFGTGGIARTSFGDLLSAATDIVIQPDGKIVVVGLASVGFGADVNFALARFQPGGTLDSSFGVGGKVTTPFDGNLLDGAFSVALQPDGKILAAGSRQNGDTEESWFAIARYNSNGSLDTSFDGDGRLFFKAGTLNEFSNLAQDVVVQNDGKIVLVGGIGDGFDETFAVVRLNPNGSFDSSFGGDGKVQTTFVNEGEGAYAVAIQSDGKLLVGGYADVDTVGSGDFDFGIVRYDANGSLDASFSGDGKATFSFGPSRSAEQIFSINIQSNGKLILAGQTGSFDGSGLATQFGVLRIDQNGDLDSGFGTNGRVITPFTAPASVGYSSAIQADGKIVVGGSSGDTGQQNASFALARYEGGGSVETFQAPFDFDGDGKTDVAIFRAAGGEWWWRRSSDGVVPAVQFGSGTDVIAPGDFTGDGKLDIAFFRPSDGFWNVLRSEDFSYYAFPFGVNGDVPVTGDYDGDGRADAAVFRGGTWYIGRSSDGGTTITGFGVAGDVPVTADYDGDGRDDIAIYRPSLGEWWINRSTAGLLAMQFGAATDRTVPGDYTGDGKADIAFWRPSTGEWYVVRSEDSSYYAFPFGQNGDIPAPGDYDGDGKMDAAIFRPSQAATWYIAGSTSGTQIVGFGVTGDRPVPNSFVR